MPESLSGFGYSFQIKLLVALLTDRKYLEQIHEVLESSYFDSDASQWLVKNIKDYFTKFKVPPTFETLKVDILNVNNEVLKTTIVDHIRDINKYINAKDLEFVKDKTLTFCKNQKLRYAIMQSIEYLKDGNYEDIKQLIDVASAAGEERDIGHDYTDDFEFRYDETQRKSVKTKWSVIDEIMDGGLGRGELGVVVAPAGIGKSWFLAKIGANALKQGLKVVHYTLELSSAYTGLRYDAILSGIPFQQLKYHKDEVKSYVDKVKDALIIKQFPPTQASVNTLNAHLKRTELFKFKPDLIIVDYADLLSTKLIKGRENSYFTSGTIYEELRGLSVELEIPIWTASQSQRSSLDQDIVEAQHIAESYKKIMTADFVMSVSRKTEDKIAGTGRIHIIKNRFGPDGITYNTKINASNGLIEIYDSGTLESKEEQNKQNKHSEYIRRTMASKYKEFNE